MAKRAKKRTEKGVFVPASDGQVLERRFRGLYNALNETIRSQRRSADQLELALNKTVEKFRIFWFGGGGGGGRRKY